MCRGVVVIVAMVFRIMVGARAVSRSPGGGVVAVTVERPSPLSAPIVFVWDGPGAPIGVSFISTGVGGGAGWRIHCLYLLI